MDTTVFSNSKIISIKRDVQREKIRLLTIEDIRNIDFSRPWNIQFSEEKLSEEEAAEVMQDFKRADGQYVLNGLRVNLFKLRTYVCKNFIKISVRIIYAPTIVAPVIVGEAEDKKND